MVLARWHMGLGCNSDSHPVVSNARSFQGVCPDSLQSSAIPSKKIWDFQCISHALREASRSRVGPISRFHVRRESVRAPSAAPLGAPLAPRKAHVETLHIDVETLHICCQISEQIAGTMGGRRCSASAARSAAARSWARGRGHAAAGSDSRGIASKTNDFTMFSNY